MGDSLRRQYQATKEYCERNNMELLDRDYKDLGVSAFRGKNIKEGSLKALLEDAQAGRIKKDTYLIIESLDRMSRDDVREQMALFLQILNAGLNIVTLMDNERIYYRKGHPDAKDQDITIELIISLTIMSRGHEESLTKSRRVKESWGQTVKRMKSGETVPVRNLPSWIEKSDNTLRVKPEANKTIKFMVDLLLKEDLGGKAIVKRLKQEGIKPWKGLTGGWTEQHVYNTLKNPSTYGLYQHYQWEGKKRIGTPVDEFMYYPPVISKEVFTAIQARFKERSNKGGGAGIENFHNIFRGYANCICGESLQLHTNYANRRKYLYLQCKAHCGTRLNPMKAIISLSFVAAMNIDWLGVVRGTETKTQDQISHNEKIRYEIAELTKQSEMLLDVWRKSQSPTLLEEVAKNDAKKAELESQIVEVKTNFNFDENSEALKNGELSFGDEELEDPNIRRRLREVYKHTFEEFQVWTPDINCTLVKVITIEGEQFYLASYRQGIKSEYKMLIWSLGGWKEATTRHPKFEKAFPPVTDLKDFWERRVQKEIARDWEDRVMVIG